MEQITGRTTIVAATVLTATATALWATAAAPAALIWALTPAAGLLGALLCHRAAGDPAQAPAARSYWRITSYAMLTLTLSNLLRALAAAGLPGAEAAALPVHAVGAILMIGPLMRLPLAVRGRRERIGFWLDMTTMLAAAGVLLWHFVGERVLRDLTGGGLLPFSVLMAAGLLGVFLAAKVVLGGAESFPPRAMYAVGTSGLFGGLGTAIAVLLGTGDAYPPLMAFQPISLLLVALGAWFQLGGTGPARRTRRSFSLLPYAAVGAVDVLLVHTAIEQGFENMLVVIVAVLLTGLVIVRQLLAFHTNDALIDRIRGQEERFRLLVQNSTDVVTITGLDNVVRYVSPSVRHVLGQEPDDRIGTNVASGMHEADRPVARAALERIGLTPNASVTYQVRVAHADGTWRWFEIITTNLMHEPSVGGRVSNARDVTETREVQDRLSHEATHDALTGLANRTLFGEQIRRGVTAGGPDHRVSIVLVDLDDFKIVNDTLGHAVGDALLVAVADRMRANVRPGDTVARLGGDEFAILFDGLGPDAAERVLQRIAEALLVPVGVQGHLIGVRASFGLVEGRTGDDAGDLLRQADIAMYEAKERGDGGHQRYVPGMETRGVERDRAATALRIALAAGQFVLHYQPVVTLPGRTVTGVEALVRWQHPERGLVGPMDFVPVAEETGLIVPLGRWVLREATRQTAAWLAAYGPDAPASIAVNASARQLRDPGFAADVTHALADSGLDPHRLIIEITESTAIGGGATVATLRELRALGVRISLDDFGTGASTLSLLAEFPVDQIKLDRAFTPGPAGHGAIAAAVVQLAKAFGVEAVAEGVETREQAEALRDLGYEHAQGYHFARPMPAAAIDATMRTAVTA